MGNKVGSVFVTSCVQILPGLTHRVAFLHLQHGKSKPLSVCAECADLTVAAALRDRIELSNPSGD